MPSQKLTRDLRLDMARALVDRAFRERKAELDKRQAEVAEEIRIHSFGGPAMAAKADKLPSGWLHTSSSICWRHERKWHSFNFGCEKRVPDYVRGSSVDLMDNGELLGRAFGLEDDIQEYRQDRSATYDRTLATLTGFTTTKRLFEAWPEIEPVVAHLLDVRPTNLPAVPRDAMNKLLDLPVDQMTASKAA